MKLCHSYWTAPVPAFANAAGTYASCTYEYLCDDEIRLVQWAHYALGIGQPTVSDKLTGT